MKKVAISCEEPSLDALVDPRFGRAAGFLIVDTEDMSFEYIDNGATQTMARGAGIQAAETVARSGAKTLLTGFVGPNAFKTLEGAGVEIVQNMNNMTAKEAVERFCSGQFEVAAAPNPNRGGGGGGGGRGGRRL